MDKGARDPVRPDGPVGPGPRQTLGERLAAWQKRQVLLVALLMLAAILAAIGGIAGAVSSFHGWYEQHLAWRGVEYAKLNSLQAGFDITEFEQQLGHPKFRSLVKHHLIVSSFKGRGYWVQTVQNPEGTVVRYAVTSCMRDFQPSFTLQGGDPGDEAVVLNKTTIAEAGRASSRLDYFVGNTATSYFIESIYGGNASSYRTYYVGVDDACNFLTTFRIANNASKLNYNGNPRKANETIKRFRRLTLVNTWAESASSGRVVSPSEIPVGVDRIDVRNVPTSP